MEETLSWPELIIAITVLVLVWTALLFLAGQFFSIWRTRLKNRQSEEFKELQERVAKLERQIQKVNTDDGKRAAHK